MSFEKFGKITPLEEDKKKIEKEKIESGESPTEKKFKEANARLEIENQDRSRENDHRFETKTGQFLLECDQEISLMPKEIQDPLFDFVGKKKLESFTPEELEILKKEVQGKIEKMRGESQ